MTTSRPSAKTGNPLPKHSPSDKATSFPCHSPVALCVALIICLLLCLLLGSLSLHSCICLRGLAVKASGQYIHSYRISKWHWGIRNKHSVETVQEFCWPYSRWQLGVQAPRVQKWLPQRRNHWNNSECGYGSSSRHGSLRASRGWSSLPRECQVCHAVHNDWH